MKFCPLSCRISSAAALVLLSPAINLPARADSIADFYKGRTINILIGVNVGGGYDIEVAPDGALHPPAHPGQSHRRCAEYGRRGRHQDGQLSVCGRAAGWHRHRHVSQHADCRAGGRHRRVQYNSTRFIWLGSISTIPLTFAVWHTAGIRTLDEAQKKK